MFHIRRLGVVVAVVGALLALPHAASAQEATITGKIVDSTGGDATSGELNVNIAEDSSVKLDDLRWRPSTAGRYELRAEVLNRAGERLSENLYEFEVK